LSVADLSVTQLSVAELSVVQPSSRSRTINPAARASDCTADQETA
jgi:hypothetical protein